MPQIVKAFGLSNTETGLVSALPPLAGALAMVPWGRHSDRTGERRWHVALPAFIGGAGLLAGTFAATPALSLAALMVAAIGVYAALPDVLDASDRTPLRHGGGSGNRAHQLDRQHRRLCRPLRRRLAAGRGISKSEAVAAISVLMIMSGLIVFATTSKRSPH